MHKHTFYKERSPRGGAPRWVGPALAGVAALSVVACDSLLDVSDPDIVTPDQLQTEQGLETLRNGAIRDLALALDGSGAGHGATPGLIHFTGILSDEYVYSGTFPTRREVDERRILPRNGTIAGIYSNLHRARASAREAGDAVAQFADGGSDSRLGELRSLEGMTHLFFGEVFCSGVPFSFVGDGGEIVFGEPTATDAMFERAVSLFDEAVANADGSDAVLNLARVGRARALLNLGRFTEAASAVSGVPTSFAYNLEHSSASPAQQNGLYMLSTVRRQFSVGDGKGENGLPFRSAMDPRVPWEDNGVLGQDDRTPYFNQLKFSSDAAAVALADGVEARLIEAEAALQANDLQTLENIHNALRATVGLDPVDLSAMSTDEREAFHFRERAFWLWSTGHRPGDMRRLVRQYAHPQDQVFPSGPYFKGGTYGDDVNIPIPVEEENNPNFQGCVNRNP